MITAQLEQNLDPPGLALLKRLGQVAFENHVLLYLVGGSVRDCLLGLPVVDLDVTSETPAAEVARLLEREAGARVRARSQFGTLKLQVQGRTMDLATARSERYVQPGALPQVLPGAMEKDLARRDFSINAMAVALWPAKWGALLDPAGGQQDLERRTVRALYETGFRDDATRLLRAVRYAVRLGFRIERRTRDWLQRDLGYLDTISPPRLRQELDRLLREPRSTAGLLRAHRLGVLSAIHPPLGRPAVAGAIRAAARSRPGPLTLLAVLAYPLADQEAIAFAQRLGIAGKQRQLIEQVRLLKVQEQSLAAPGLAPHQVVEQLERHAAPAVEALATLAGSPLARSRLRRYLRSWRCVTPALNGNDLARLGVAPGPTVGRLLRELRRARLDGRIRSRRTETAYVRKAVARAGPAS